MPRYFFHLHNDIDAVDEEGLELPDLQAARDQALRDARHMAAASVVEHGRINLRHHIDVADDCGQVLCSATFGEAVTIAN